VAVPSTDEYLLTVTVQCGMKRPPQQVSWKPVKVELLHDHRCAMSRHRLSNFPSIRWWPWPRRLTPDGGEGLHWPTIAHDRIFNSRSAFLACVCPVITDDFMIYGMMVMLLWRTVTSEFLNINNTESAALTSFNVGKEQKSSSENVKQQHGERTKYKFSVWKL